MTTYDQEQEMSLKARKILSNQGVTVMFDLDYHVAKNIVKEHTLMTATGFGLVVAKISNFFV